MTRAAETIHGTAVALAVDADGPLVGILLLGESASGKSSLALAAIDSCPYARTALVADDMVVVKGDAASAPAPIRGLIEIRGFGPASVRTIAGARLRLALDLSAPPERTPEARQFRLRTGPPLPLYGFLWKGAEATAAPRLRAVARAVLGGQSSAAAQDSALDRGQGTR
jgi:HPr kinase/phosphorylase